MPTPLPCNDELLSKLKEICKNKKVLVAASTHSGEEDEILKAHRSLRKEFDLITIVIPRHLTRITELMRLFDTHQVTYQLRSKLSSSATDVICIDTFGEVGTCFRLADVTFVGGSLVPIGGHNIYEPISLGKPVLFGPHMGNALEVRNLILKNQVGFEVKSHEDIVNYCRKFFSDANFLNNIKEKTEKLMHNESLRQIDEIVNFSLQKFCNQDKR